MSFMFDISAEISPDEIAKMIRDHAEKETGRVVDNVTFNVGYRGGGIAFFRNATVTFKKGEKYQSP
jgi:hypothetical protein